MPNLKQDTLAILNYAIMAPSGYNTQPWLFQIDHNNITIKPDLSRALPCVDPNHRELYISLGCCLENMNIAANQLGYDLNIISLSGGGICTKLTLATNTNNSIDFSLDLLKNRQTNRRTFNGHAINETELYQCMTQTIQDPNIHIHFWKNGTTEFEIVKKAIVQGNNKQMANAEFIAELSYWIRYNKSHSIETLDGLGYDAFGAPNLPRWLSKKIMSGFLNSQKQNQSDIKKIDSSSHFILLTTQNNEVNDWIQLGQKLQRFLLSLTQKGISSTYMNQPCEEEEITEQLKQQLNIANQYPAIILRVGYAKPMPYSKRRPVSCVLID
ncbi:Acg family FMN-binding oxidoreductase [Neisseria sp. Ec49-e6-T10]|uniref:Acg family FMN-binding oxidoreductase n=1 Tax=Neisseria sp. Ec49-e6-T10 TaxID=3140744 RepID=UPI003EB751F5